MKKNLKWILAVLTVGWMVLIFVMSSADSAKSADMSRGIDRTLARTVHHDFDKWEQERQNEYIMKIDHPVRKIAHFAEYAVLGILLTSTFRTWGADLLRTLLLSFSVGTAYAAADEIHQSFVSGRSLMFSDVMIDCAGLLLGCAVFVLAFLIFTGKRKKKIKNGS